MDLTSSSLISSFDLLLSFDRTHLFLFSSLFSSDLGFNHRWVISAKEQKKMATLTEPLSSLSFTSSHFSTVSVGSSNHFSPSSASNLEVVCLSKWSAPILSSFLVTLIVITQMQRSLWMVFPLVSTDAFYPLEASSSRSCSRKTRRVPRLRNQSTIWKRCCLMERLGMKLLFISLVISTLGG